MAHQNSAIYLRLPYDIMQVARRGGGEYDKEVKALIDTNCLNGSPVHASTSALGLADSIIKIHIRISYVHKSVFALVVT